MNTWEGSNNQKVLETVLDYYVNENKFELKRIMHDTTLSLDERLFALRLYCKE